jgi:hypothetical protein
MSADPPLSNQSSNSYDDSEAPVKRKLRDALEELEGLADKSKVTEGAYVQLAKVLKVAHDVCDEQDEDQVLYQREQVVIEYALKAPGTLSLAPDDININKTDFVRLLVKRRMEEDDLEAAMENEENRQATEDHLHELFLVWKRNVVQAYLGSSGYCYRSQDADSGEVDDRASHMRIAGMAALLESSFDTFEAPVREYLEGELSAHWSACDMVAAFSGLDEDGSDYSFSRLKSQRERYPEVFRGWFKRCEEGKCQRCRFFCPLQKKEVAPSATG